MHGSTAGFLQMPPIRKSTVRESPFINLAFSKIWTLVPGTLSTTEMESLLQQPDTGRPLGIRDKAMLELLYATGIRVSELNSLTINDIHWQVGYLVTMGKGRERKGSSDRKCCFEGTEQIYGAGSPGPPRIQ